MCQSQALEGKWPYYAVGKPVQKRYTLLISIYLEHGFVFQYAQVLFWTT